MREHVSMLNPAYYSSGDWIKRYGWTKAVAILGPLPQASGCGQCAQVTNHIIVSESDTSPER